MHSSLFYSVPSATLPPVGIFVLFCFVFCLLVSFLSLNLYFFPQYFFFSPYFFDYAFTVLHWLHLYPISTWALSCSLPTLFPSFFLSFFAFLCTFLYLHSFDRAVLVSVYFWIYSDNFFLSPSSIWLFCLYIFVCLSLLSFGKEREYHCCTADSLCCYSVWSESVVAGIASHTVDFWARSNHSRPWIIYRNLRHPLWHFTF